MRRPTPGKSFGRAQRLRKALTPPEIRLWKRLKGRPKGVKFARQHPEGVYILDFYCLEAWLAVEVDGSTHRTPERVLHDERRDAWLAEQGIEVMRLAAAEVMANPDWAAEEAIARAQSRIADAQPSSPERSEGEVSRRDGGAAR